MDISSRPKPLWYQLVTYCFLLVTLLSSCSVVSTPSPEILPFIESNENYPRAEVIFSVTLPQNLSENEDLVLEVLDDLTGEFFNPKLYKLSSTDGKIFSINLPFIVGEKVKYRYVRYGEQTLYEYTAKNEPLQYRLYYVNGPGLVEDAIAAWQDQPYTGSYGRIRGQLVEKSTQLPVPNVSISAAGIRTISAADGSFILEGLSPGLCNVVISSLDGAFETFQQGALIAEESTTPIILELQKRSFVDVNFLVKLPEGFYTELPLRFASNLSLLGYPETKLSAGGYTSAANLPEFTPVSNSEYTLSLSLPVGEHIRYKFTLGDGFWNAELGQEGNFVVRDLVVSKNSTDIRKKIASFDSPGIGPVLFEITTSELVPANEEVAIQFNAIGWTEPIPMRKTGINQWRFTLHSPTHLLPTFEYRFCRNGSCDKAISDSNSNAVVTTHNLPQTISLELVSWDFLDSVSGLTNVETNGGSVQPRTDFITGYELISEFPITWANYIDDGLASISSTAANWVIYSPTWSVTNINPPLFEPLPGHDLLWPELKTMSAHISTNHLQSVIFPILADETELNEFWLNGKRDIGWWQTFYERYQRFILQNADLAQITEASAFILGDPGMRPSMKDGALSNGSSSNSPANADEQWGQLVRDVRAHYTGPIIGVVSFPELQANAIPSWIKEVDAIYILFSPPLVSSDDNSVISLVTTFDQVLDAEIYPILGELGKPVLFGLDYPSNSQAINGCVSTNGSCLHYGSGNFSDQTVDLDLQTKIYNAAILSCARHTWINGFIARGYNPTVVLRDQSSSLYGKPASDVLWFWFHFLQNRPS